MSYDLSQREVDLLVRIAMGKTNSHIAQDLYVTEQTIKNRVYHLMDKLGAQNRIRLATFACFGYFPSEIQLRTFWYSNKSEGRYIPIKVIGNR